MSVLNTTKTLVLSAKARDALLEDIENPPDPPEALVSGMQDFWEQFDRSRNPVDA